MSSPDEITVSAGKIVVFCLVYCLVKSNPDSKKKEVTPSCLMDNDKFMHKLHISSEYSG